VTRQHTAMLPVYGVYIIIITSNIRNEVMSLPDPVCLSPRLLPKFHPQKQPEIFGMKAMCITIWSYSTYMQSFNFRPWYGLQEVFIFNLVATTLAARPWKLPPTVPYLSANFQLQICCRSWDVIRWKIICNHPATHTANQSDTHPISSIWHPRASAVLRNKS